MSDLTLSLIVVALTGALILPIFILISRHRQAKEKEIEAYCREHGYVFSKRREPLGSFVTVEGPGFLLESKMVAHRQEEVTGSSSWEIETLWTARGLNGTLPTFILGSVSAAADWHSMPDMIRNAAAQKLLSAADGSFKPDSGRLVHKSKTMAFLMFEEVPESTQAAADRLIPLLDIWPTNYPLLIRGAEDNLSVRALGLFLRDTAMLDLVTRLGRALTG